MDDYVEKPVRTAALDAAIEQLDDAPVAEHRRHRHTAARGVRRPASSSTPKP
jgi:hypothetical protein